MPAVGDRLVDRYRIVAPLGSGGMATVWRAHDERLDRDVAIKVLLPNLAGDPVVARRFEQEARAMAANAHPGLVAVFDVDAGDPETGREPFVVMELCPGGSLADRFALAGRMAPDELVPILVAVGDALAALHRAGLVHRDIKPANILFAADRVKLGDFGLARAGVDGPDAGPSGLTEPGTAIGTLAYLAPERLSGAAAGPAADVYALATVAFLGLTGSLPRPTASIRDAVAAAGFRPPRVSTVAPALGPFFDEPVADALAVDPARRPDPLTFGSALAAALGRWTRAGRPGADGATPAAGAAPVAAGPAPVADDITTAVAIPTGATSTYEAPAAGAAPAPTTAGGRVTRTSTGGRLVVAASLIAALLIGAAILAGLASRGGPPAGAASSPTAAVSIAPSASASPGPSPSIERSPPPPAATPTQDPALAALDAMDRAIEAAKGGPDGLKGKEANELESRVTRIADDLDRGDREAALREARELERRVRDVTEDLEGDARERLRAAADALVAALGG